jgi:hypothetical protein
MTMSGEFWAAIAGAVIGGLLSGIISWLLQRSSYIEARRQRAEDERAMQRMLSTALLIKMNAIYSDINSCHKHFEESIKNAQASDSTLEPWQCITKLSNVFPNIQFTMDELTFVHQLADLDLFNDLSNMDRVHHAIRETVLTYIEKRSTLEDMIISIRIPSSLETNGNLNSTFVKIEDTEVLKPKILEISSLLNQARPMLTRSSTEAKNIMVRLHNRLKESRFVKGNLEFAQRDV